MPYFFKVRLIPLLVTVLVCVAGISLGQWQTRRAIEKEEIAAATSQRHLMPNLEFNEIAGLGNNAQFRNVTLKGEFVRNWPLYLDNRPLNGVAGFYVLMPFKMDGSDRFIMVARGWQPRNPSDRTRMPALLTPNGVVRIDGVLKTTFDRVMQLGAPEQIAAGAIMQNLRLPDVSEVTGMKFLNMVVEQTSDSPDGLQRVWPAKSAGSDKHRAYAFQWYALSIMAIIFFCVTGFRRGKN
jgi:surfeit locus 1 family protein